MILQEHRRKSKQKSRKHKKDKRNHARAQERTPSHHSGSPCLEDKPQAVAMPSTSVVAVEGTRETTSPENDNAVLAKGVDQMDGLLATISVATPGKQAVHSTEPSESEKPVAPRLQAVSGGLSGRVGDGGNNWRRRIQRRAAEQAAERGTQFLHQRHELPASTVPSYK